MKISLIIPAYKAGEYLPSLIKQVAAQVEKPFETIVCVDGCPETLEAVKGVSGRDLREAGVKVIYIGENQGAYTAINTGVLYSSGDLITVFGADDVMYPDHIKVLRRGLEDCEVIKASGRRKGLGKKKAEISGKMKKRGIKGVVMMSRKLFLKVNGYEPWRCHGDAEFLQRLEGLGYKTKVSKIITMDYIKRPDSLTESAETGLRSPLRNKYRELAAEKLRNPSLPAKLNTADYREVVLWTTEKS